ncbi:hypothetical protein D3C84_849830 [compost metagenome]
MQRDRRKHQRQPQQQKLLLRLANQPEFAVGGQRSGEGDPLGLALGGGRVVKQKLLPEQRKSDLELASLGQQKQRCPPAAITNVEGQRFRLPLRQPLGHSRGGEGSRRLGGRGAWRLLRSTYSQ